MVLGGSLWFLVVLVVLGDSWWFLVVLGVLGGSYFVLFVSFIDKNTNVMHSSLSVKSL